MNPNPLSSLNHFTVPVDICLPFDAHRRPRPDAAQGTTARTIHHMAQVTTGDGYAVSSLSELGEGPGFRKVRQEFAVQAFGVNAIVLPPGIETGPHFHDEQEELYFVHAGSVEM